MFVSTQPISLIEMQTSKNRFLVLQSASLRLDEIYLYTQHHWGDEQAKLYIEGIFQHFSKLATNTIFKKPIPAEFEVLGWVSRYEKHFIYSRRLSSGELGIVTILHEKMHQFDGFKSDFLSL